MGPPNFEVAQAMPFAFIFTTGLLIMSQAAGPIEQATSNADSWKRACLSDAGIAVLAKYQLDQQAIDREEEVTLQRLTAELVRVASKVPVEIDQLQRAAEARDSHRYAMDQQDTRSLFDMLKQLNAKDQQIVLYFGDLGFQRPPRPPVTACP